MFLDKESDHFLDKESSIFLDTESNDFLDTMSTDFLDKPAPNDNHGMAIPTRLRKKIADFDPLQAGITITQFCKDNSISRQTYFNIKKRITTRGRAGILPDSTAPKTPHRRYGQDIRSLVIDTRTRLAEEGRDCGPWSIYYYLIDEAGITNPPARATIATWLTSEGLVDANARKRPRSSWRRFSRDKAGELWQIDGLVYRLFDTDHTQVTIYQIIDDATRLDVGTAAFPTPENGHDARTALQAAFDNYGLPQEILSDNGHAFATYHRGYLSQTEIWLAGLGVRASAGFAPTTQGKDERSHQTLTKFLDRRKPVTLQELRTYLAQYRDFYNNQRRHQGLLRGKMHITPAQAWQIFPHASAPTKPIDVEVLEGKLEENNRVKHGTVAEDAAFTTVPGAGLESFEQDPQPTTPTLPTNQPISWDIPEELRINNHGVVRVGGYRLYVGTRFKNRQICCVIGEDDHARFFTIHDGEELFSFPLPIRLSKRPAGGQININFVIGSWHRNPPQVNERLSHPRPSRARRG